MSTPTTNLPSPARLESMALRMEKGLASDIWYDADEHDDEPASATIEDTQMAMQEAILVLRALATQGA